MILKLSLIKKSGYAVVLSLGAIAFLISCGEHSENKSTKNQQAEVIKQPDIKELLVEQPESLTVPDGMVWVSGVHFTQGASNGDEAALPREKPAHPVAVDGFFIDKTEVTNAQFKKFVAATGYRTVAEQPIDWEEMKKDLPQELKNRQTAFCSRAR